MKIELFGDWCPGGRSVDIDFKSEIAFVNVEGPILVGKQNSELIKIDKLGPHLYSTVIPSFSERYVYSLANNHIMDYGITGLINTIDQLKNTQGECVGFKTSSTTRDFIITELKNGIKVGIIANAERQFGFSDNGSPGYTPVTECTLSLIKEIKKQVDFVFVSHHGGDEKSLQPSMKRRHLFRSFIEAGADVVWGHHSHVPQGWEFWKKGLICYGMGNFVTDPDLISHKGLGKYALTVNVDLNEIRNSSFGLTVQELVHGRIKVSRISLDSNLAYSYFRKINEILANDALLIPYLDMYSEKIIKQFYSKILPIYPLRFWSRYFIFSLLSLLKNSGHNRYRETLKSLKLHLQTCESHRHMLQYFQDRRQIISSVSHRSMQELHQDFSDMRLH
jgi:hypothetical protein